LIERIELSRERVLIILRCEQVRAFLGWPGNGLFKMRPNADGRHHHVFVLEAEAFAVRTERQFRLPIDVGRGAGAPKRGLVDLMTFARQVQGIVYGERRSVEEVARRFSRRPTFVSRALRLNYLAPDIIAAIVDGRQPRDLTRRKLLNASIPTGRSNGRFSGFLPSTIRNRGTSITETANMFRQRFPGNMLFLPAPLRWHRGAAVATADVDPTAAEEGAAFAAWK
jgi:hypothetical protein